MGPSRDRSHRRCELEDAYWSVRPVEYVGPPSTADTSIFDDEDRLDRSLDAMVSTLEAQSRESEQTRDRVIARAADLIAKLDSVEACEPEDNGEEGAGEAESAHSQARAIRGWTYAALWPTGQRRVSATTDRSR